MSLQTAQSIIRAGQTIGLLEDIIENRRRKVDEEKRWRALDVTFRGLERDWWAVDAKRLYTDQLVERMSVFGELTAFAAGFQAVMLYELELPPLEEHRYSHALLAVWGLGSLAVTCTNVCLMFMAMLITIGLLIDSEREPPWSLPRCRAHAEPPWSRQEREMPPPAGCLVHSDVFLSAEQYRARWHQQHEPRVMGMLTAFNYSAPLFMFNLGLSTLIKFYTAPAAGWTGFACSLCGMLAWWHWRHSYFPKVQYLQAQAAEIASGRGRDADLQEPERHRYLPDSDSARLPMAHAPDAPRSDNSAISQQALEREQREPLTAAARGLTRASVQPAAGLAESGAAGAETRGQHLETDAGEATTGTTPWGVKWSGLRPPFTSPRPAGPPSGHSHLGDGGHGESRAVLQGGRTESTQARVPELGSPLDLVSPPMELLSPAYSAAADVRSDEGRSAAPMGAAGEELFGCDPDPLASSPSLAAETGDESGGGGEAQRPQRESDAAAGPDRATAHGAHDPRDADGVGATHEGGVGGVEQQAGGRCRSPAGPRPLAGPPVSASSPTGTRPLSTLIETDETLTRGQIPLRWGSEGGEQGGSEGGEQEIFYSDEEGDEDAMWR